MSISYAALDSLGFWPSSIRSINCSDKNSQFNSFSIPKNATPHLNSIIANLPIKVCESLKLKDIFPFFISHTDYISLKPRKVLVSKGNCLSLMKYPEIFEKVSNIVVEAEEFNFDLLPRKISNAKLYENIDTQNLGRNAWKFASANVQIMSNNEQEIVNILYKLPEAQTVTVEEELFHLQRYYKHLKFCVNLA